MQFTEGILGHYTNLVFKQYDWVHEQNQKSNMPHKCLLFHPQVTPVLTKDCLYNCLLWTQLQLVLP